jgi:hypothetical protein
MEYIKGITNQMTKKLEVTLIIRKGDDPQNTWGTKNITLEPGQSRDVVLPNEANPNDLPFLNGLGLRCGMLYHEQRVETRGDAFDNLLNTNSKLTIAGLPAESIIGSN